MPKSPPPIPPAFDAVIFDQDGTLTDTMEVIYEAFVNTAERFGGGKVTKDELFAAMGPPEEKMLGKLLPEKSLPEAIEFFFSHYDKASDRIRLFPGIEEALEHLRQAGVKMGLFTGMGRRGTRWTFDVLGLGRWIASPVTGNDVERYKPDPEGVFKALAAAGVSPNRAMVVGDSPYDIMAGQAAGTKTGIALWGVRDPSRFDKVSPDYRFERPADLLRAVLPDGPAFNT